MGLPQKQRQHECSSNGNRPLVKRNPPSSSGGTDLRISSPNTLTRNGNFCSSDGPVLQVLETSHPFSLEAI
ncbi:unnamed protein product [Protopolystoma xenopodis]|uniref:Uncharacterized protein n=1 Tax=Protopolystoma xenopodis TaxID=117903 RepID=A0A3S4ZXD7_9PLAT|nr:unnamed protein product [Protopolystoma xenopodis]